MTGNLAASAAQAVGAVPDMIPLAATGAQSAAWLLIAFPLAGAALLLLGGRRTNRIGHLVGVAMPVVSPSEIAWQPYPSRFVASSTTRSTGTSPS